MSLQCDYAHGQSSGRGKAPGEGFSTDETFIAYLRQMFHQAFERLALSRRCHVVAVRYFATKNRVLFYCFGSSIDLTLLTIASSFQGVARP
jgi:hypothetical protein